MKYIDADRLKAKITKERKNIEGLFIEGDNNFYDGQDDAYNHVLVLIDSLQQEQPEVDLKKALNSLDDVYFDLGGIAVKGATYYLTVEDLKDIARDFYELGKNNK